MIMWLVVNNHNRILVTRINRFIFGGKMPPHNVDEQLLAVHSVIHLDCLLKGHLK